MNTANLLVQISQLLEDKPDLSEIADDRLEKLISYLEQKENSLELKTISELQKANFFVDSYQRGYKWTKQQVEELLDDIDEFEPKQERDFYCLQPVVVKRKTEGTQYYWELIDGQQRMTTIFIILTYLTNEQYFSLRYETRESSTEHLNNIAGLTENNLPTIDAHYFYTAYQTVKKWFEEKGSEFNRERWKDKLLNNTKVIWYAVRVDRNQDSKKQSIEIFSRLNQGKIPLTDAELIKALFLQKIAQAYGHNHLAVQKQTEMANQWDAIEQALQNDEFWAFLSPTQQTNKHTRIELVFDLIADKSTDKKALKLKEDHQTFIHYANKFKSAQDVKDLIETEWLKVLTGFQYLNEWYENDRLYHLIGYLIGQKYKTIQDIWIIAQGCKRDEFEAKLKNFIQLELSNLFKKDKNAKELDFEHVFYDADDTSCRPKIKSILVLFNIFRYERHNTRFSFKRYNQVKWDIEHIHAQQSEELSSKDDQIKVWVSEQKALLEEITDSISKEKLGEILTQYETVTDPTQKEYLYNQYNEILETLIGSFSENIQTLDNLCLLPESDNRSIGNDPFFIKRKKVLQAEKELYELGKTDKANFIPLASQQVFSKYFSDDVNHMLKWDTADRKNYKQALLDCFKQYGIEFHDENEG
ncbi:MULTISPECIES: DUF262 domain-containing protein [Acinetobacter]|uniref:DUF262 domain-containing protein n=1 Tax=Acinetobacter TaxID=469 RepID=UPI0032122686